MYTVQLLLLMYNYILFDCDYTKPLDIVRSQSILIWKTEHGALVSLIIEMLVIM